jgi:glycosyltransferase involved in cell wall biosynthesis
MKSQGNKEAALQFELVVPAFNEGASLRALVERAQRAAQAAGLLPGQVRLVVVDNGSDDDTQATLAELERGPLGPFVRSVHVPVNQGYGHGLWAGLSTSRAPYVGWTHADEQCDPADAFLALARVQAAGGRALVKGRRRGRAVKDVLFSRTFETCAHLALNLGLDEVNAQPKVMPRSLLGQFSHPPKDFAFDLYALYQARKSGYAVQSIDVTMRPRAHGTSRWARGIVRRSGTILRMLGHMAELQRREGRLRRAR